MSIAFFAAMILSMIVLSFQGLLALSFSYALSAKYKNGLEVDPCVL